MSRSLCAVAIGIWEIRIQHDIIPVAMHVSGDCNTIADLLSREKTLIHEWSIGIIYITPIFEIWGTPFIDVFATAKNSKCRWFCTRGGHDHSSLGDSLLPNWGKDFLYMFPPFPLLPRVLRKIQCERAHVLLIAPWWPCQTWFPHYYAYQNTILYVYQRHRICSHCIYRRFIIWTYKA